MSVSASPEQRRRLAIENASYPNHLISIHPSEWRPVAWDKCERIEVWRSRNFLVQIFAQANGAERLTVCRTKVMGHTWQDGISWDDLQKLKAECGRGKKWAVEIFPAEQEVVNVANMRHLWVLPDPPAFAWRRDFGPSGEQVG